ncbi:hypothetical protein BGZ54_004211 [Gamsiella multidivaricata]|nr:hypothetical protein BGZ54_004211 [Gamsiella multidivaricata]
MTGSSIRLTNIPPTTLVNASHPTDSPPAERLVTSLHSSVVQIFGVQPSSRRQFSRMDSTGAGPATPTFSNGNGVSKKPAYLKNLQPRAAAAKNFNDNDDTDEKHGVSLSADYRAQKKTTEDLVAFFRSSPPPSPIGASGGSQHQRLLSTLSAATATHGEDEKKKRSLLQRLRPKKSGTNLNSGSGGGTGKDLRNGNRRSSMLVPSVPEMSSSINSTSGMATTGRDENDEEATTATLPNGKKYIMIAVDYKNPTSGANGAGAGGSNALMSPAASSIINTASSRGQSQVSDELKSALVAVHPPGESKRTSAAVGAHLQSSMLDSTPFLLDSLSVLEDATTSVSDFGGSASSQANVSHNLQRSVSTKSSVAESGAGDMSRTGSKRTSRVTFSTPRSPAAPSTALPPMDENEVAEALTQRIASHKAKQQQAKSANGNTDNKASTSGSSFGSISRSTTTLDFPEVAFRKKVRHVQIQTQHCIMRPIHTQTEPYESLVHDLEVKDWSFQTTDVGTIAAAITSSSSKEDGAEIATLTTAVVDPMTMATRSAATSPIAVTSSSTFSSNATTFTSTGSISTSTSTETISTDASTSTSPPSSPAHDDELAQLRQQNVLLKKQVASLQRDLAAETRARTRHMLSMQDTRDKFEMLSAMAYKKLKEMIFQRHVLEMEVRELRAQVDLQSEVNVVQQGEMLFRQEQMQMQQQQQHQQYRHQFV